MNKLTKNSVTHPQTIEIPQPLEVHPSVSPLAASLLMQVAERLAQFPETYDQGEPRCGSVMCIIGHMASIAGLNPETCAHRTEFHKQIGLTWEQCESFYWRANWPVKAYENGKTTANIGIARIEHFLRTGE